MADLIGQRLGNYRLLRLIGRGGFADVYLAEHIHLGTQAAIKVLQVRLVESNREKFLNEARTIAHLVHPYIIRVLDFGVEDEIPFLVMDYAPRGTFRQRFLQQGRPLPAAPLVSFIKQAAAALQYGHDKQLIHRDVKPENMLLGPNDEILLSDFGFALIAHNSVSSIPAEAAGTAAYMAPEQLQGKPRPASDQYALGIIAYEWLSGGCPFHGSFFEIASQQVLTPPPSLREKVPTIAPEIVRVVMTALEKDPQLRFPTVRAFALALEDACLASKQYAFNLQIAQPAAPPGTGTSGVTFPTPNQRSRDHLPLASENRSLSFDLPGEMYKQFSIEPALTDIPMHMHTSQVGSNQSFRSGASFSLDIQPQAYKNSMRLSVPPLGEALISQPGLPQSARPAANSFSNADLYTERRAAPALPVLPQAAPPSSIVENALQPGQIESRSATNIRAPRPQDRISKPNEILLIILLILLVLGISSGAYSYVIHSKNNDATQTASSKQQQTRAKIQSATMAKTSPTTTQRGTGVIANPYPPYSGTFVMNETLASNNYGWQESTATAIGGACQFVEGGYQDYSPIIDPNPCFAYNTNFTNFTYQIDMKFISIGQLHSGGGIVFRGDSTNDRYYYFEVYNSGKYSFAICNAGDCTLQLAGYKLLNQPLDAFHPGLGVTNTLAVVSTGSKFDLYLNNQLVKEVVDPNNTYKAGVLGVLATGGNNNDLRTAATSTPAQVLFSNAKVWKL